MADARLPQLSAVELLRKVIDASPPPSSTPSPPLAPVSPPTPPPEVPYEVAHLLHEAISIDQVQDNALKEAWDSFLAQRLATDSENLVGVAQLGLSRKDGQWSTFKDLIKRGVPSEYRPKIWAECSGANELREVGLYKELVTRPVPRSHEPSKQIDLDIHRTFSSHSSFSGQAHLVQRLRNVLVAYSWRNAEVGYCQGMNNLVATLLLVYDDEEDAFWVLVALIDNILPQDYYTSHLLVSRADQKVFQDLVRDHLPAVSHHLAKVGVVLESLSFPWFLPLFTDCFPLPVLLRVWDVLFVLGHAILFRVGVALIKLNEEVVLNEWELSDLCTLLKEMPKRVHNADSLIQLACDEKQITVKERQVTKLRLEHVERIEEEMEEEKERYSVQSI